MTFHHIGLRWNTIRRVILLLTKEMWFLVTFGEWFSHMLPMVRNRIRRVSPPRFLIQLLQEEFQNAKVTTIF